MAASSGKRNYELEIVISGGTDASLASSIRRAKKEIDSLERQAGLSSKALSESFFGMDTKGIDALGKIIGESSGEDVIDEIFGSFCMGK